MTRGEKMEKIIKWLITHRNPVNTDEIAKQTGLLHTEVPSLVEDMMEIESEFFIKKEISNDRIAFGVDHDNIDNIRHFMAMGGFRDEE